MKNQFLATTALCYFLLLFANEARADLPEGFVYLKEVDPSIQIDVRYATSNNFVGKRVDGYKAKKIVITRRAAEALKKVQAELKKDGYGLKVFDAYRPQKAVSHFMRWVRDRNDQKTKSKYYPEIDKSTLAGSGYISGRSSHSRGSTADLTLVKLGKGEVDMGTEFDFFGPASSHNSAKVTAEQRASRQRLKAAMSRGGFASYHKEWWHYTLRNEPFSRSFDFPVQ